MVIECELRAQERVRIATVQWNDFFGGFGGVRRVEKVSNWILAIGEFRGLDLLTKTSTLGATYRTRARQKNEVEGSKHETSQKSGITTITEVHLMAGWGGYEGRGDFRTRAVRK